MIIELRSAEILNAYADTLIPGDADWPTPSQIGVIDYVERATAGSTELRSSVLFSLQTVDTLAGKLRKTTFVELDGPEQVEVMTVFQSDHPAPFAAVRELVYEAYYSSAPVRLAVERRTGFRARAALDGVGSAVFDDVLLKLADVADRPKRVRDVAK